MNICIVLISLKAEGKDGVDDSDAVSNGCGSDFLCLVFADSLEPDLVQSLLRGSLLLAPGPRYVAVATCRQKY